MLSTMEKARKIRVPEGAPAAIAATLRIAEADVLRALEGDCTAPQAKNSRGLAIVCYAGVMEATAPRHKVEKR